MSIMPIVPKLGTSVDPHEVFLYYVGKADFSIFLSIVPTAATAAPGDENS